MGNKRIYLGRENSKYAKIVGGAIITITSLFFVLMAVGFEITGSNDNCIGTLDNPCVSYGKICNLGPNNYDIYNSEGIKLDFSPTIKDYWIFFKDGRVKKEFLYNLGVNCSTKGWRYENFTNLTKPRKDRIYVHRFARYNCQDYMLVGLKENPNDIVKWGFGVEKEYLDPFWYGVGNETADISVSTILMELGSQVNVSANITGVGTVCVDVDHPDYGMEYACGSPNAQFLFNISYFRKTELNDSSTTKNLSFSGPQNQTIYIESHQYDKIINLTMNLTGYIHNGTYPKIKIYINNSLSNTINTVTAGVMDVNELTDESTEKNYSFIKSSTLSDTFKIQKEATVNSAHFNLSGYNSDEWVYTNNNFNALHQEKEMVWDGNHFWLLSWDWIGGEQSTVYKYDINLNYLGESYGIGGDSISDFISTLAWNGSNYFGLSRGLVTWYNSTWDVQGSYGTGVLELRGIAWNGSNWFYSDGATDSDIKEYDAMWNYIRIYSNVGVDVNEMVWKDNYWYLSDGSNVYKYNPDFTNTGINYSLSEDLMWDIKEGNNNWYSLGYNTKKVYQYTFPIVPINPKLEVGTIDGYPEWSYSGNFSGKDNVTSDFNSSINFYLSSCSADDDGFCAVPFYLTSESAGVIMVSNINISYTQDINPLYLDSSLIETFLENSINFIDIPITFESSKNGILEITDIRYDYIGGNDTIEVLVYEQGNKDNNETLNLFVYYSNFLKGLPYTWIDKIFFMPRTKNSKNVNAYGQTSTMPIYNITTTNYGGNINLSIRVNESFSCLNITWNTNNTKPIGNKINTTWQEIITNLEYLNNTNIWLWADFDNCNVSEQKILQSDLQIEGYCVDCIWS